MFVMPLQCDNVLDVTRPADVEVIGDGTVGHPSEHFPLKPLEASGAGMGQVNNERN